MIDREEAGPRAREFFETLWSKGDPWDIETTEITQRTHQRLIALLDGRRYRRVPEIGCGAGVFTRQLAGMADFVLALDVAPAAIERARARDLGSGTVEFRVADVMQYDPHTEGPWDLVVMSETIYYLGWLYSFFDVAWLASQLFAATAEDGQLLLANTQLGMEHPLPRTGRSREQRRRWRQWRRTNEHHARAARELPVTHFSAHAVLPPLIEKATSRRESSRRHRIET